MKAYRFTIRDVVPCARPRISTKGGHARLYPDPKTAAYQAAVCMIARAAIRERLTGYWACSIHVFTRTKRRLDLDNVAKSVVDGIVAADRTPDDCRLWQFGHITRSLTTGEDRVEVTVAEYEPQVEGLPL